jgi:hypothetical protein
MIDIAFKLNTSSSTNIMFLHLQRAPVRTSKGFIETSGPLCLDAQLDESFRRSLGLVSLDIELSRRLMFETFMVSEIWVLPSRERSLEWGE